MRLEYSFHAISREKRRRQLQGETVRAWSFIHTRTGLAGPPARGLQACRIRPIHDDKRAVPSRNRCRSRLPSGMTIRFQETSRLQHLPHKQSCVAEEFPSVDWVLLVMKKGLFGRSIFAPQSGCLCGPPIKACRSGRMRAEIFAASWCRVASF